MANRHCSRDTPLLRLLWPVDKARSQKTPVFRQFPRQTRLRRSVIDTRLNGLDCRRRPDGQSATTEDHIEVPCDDTVEAPGTAQAGRQMVARRQQFDAGLSSGGRSARGVGARPVGALPSGRSRQPAPHPCDGRTCRQAAHRRLAVLSTAAVGRRRTRRPVQDRRQGIDR